ncbi:phosphatidate cytidylyltransferase [Dokdonella fugitiva]|jgi:phosphatidate cytidylyltransferase|uniref:phosphatidate cytidylyltransferase n=1 Tax=Dokdonella fugitiva TaxID=328517 RepID=UPI0015F89DF3|nr:phosphatidate cytidylyltransferase [Dokdonella fugitiva]MBA8884062.1 phosphatidate cytidylyltransferase [Dokdonella fugitiva]
MLKQRTLTALVLAPLAVAMILLLPTAGFALVIAAMSLQAMWEWTRLAGIASTAARAAFVVANVLLLYLLWHARATPFAWYVVGAGVAWWLLSLLWLRHFSYAAAPTRENALLKLLAAELAVLPAWLAFIELHGSADHGRHWALLVVILVWAADTGAYFAGRRWGTTKLAPRISPNKTRAGAYGALVLAGAVALVGGWLLDERDAALLALLALALLTVLASILGDLIESLLKRQANVKDSGTLFPGHGGLLDRVDSVFSAVPVFVAGKAVLDLLLAS